MIFITISSINVMKKANVSTFRGKQMMIPGLLLIVLMSELSANEIVDRIAISGSKVALSCSFTASNQTVTWEIYNEFNEKFNALAACYVNTLHCQTGATNEIVSNATRSDKSSTAFVSLSEQVHGHFRCLLGDVVQQTYNITFIKKPTISPPNCTIIPTTSHQGRDATLTFSCESHVPHELPSVLTMLGFSESISTSGKSDLYVVKDVNFKNFREYINVVCELRISDVDISERCSFPQATSLSYKPDVTDVVFDCHADCGDAVTWRLLDSEGREEDITGRSWTRDGGRSLLIKNITKQDFGKVAECRVDGWVGFGIIYEIGPCKNNGFSGETGTHEIYDDRLVYVTLTYVFGAQFLITLISVLTLSLLGTKQGQSLQWQIPEGGEALPSPSSAYQDIDNPSTAGGGGGGVGRGGGGGGARGGGEPGRRGNQWEVDEEGYGIPMTVPDKLMGGDGQTGYPGVSAGQTEQYVDMSGRHRQQEKEYEMMKSLTYENC